jgi:hypothetical protein
MNLHRARRWLGVGFGLGVCGLAVMMAAPLAAQWGRGWMNGIVFGDSDTRGLAQATVELIGDRADDRLREAHLTTETDAAGKYAFERVPYGRYEFRVTAPGFVPYSIPLYVASDAASQVHVRLQRAETRP